MLPTICQGCGGHIEVDRKNPNLCNSCVTGGAAEDTALEIFQAELNRYLGTEVHAGDPQDEVAANAS